MRAPTPIYLLSLALTAACGCQGSCPSPATPAHGVVETMHGVPVPDPWRWLENGDSPDVQAWAAKQDAAARAQLSAIPVRARLKRDLDSVRAQAQWPVMPGLCQGRYFYQRIDGSQERGAIYEYDSTTKQERIILDLDSPELAGSVVSFWKVSPKCDRFVAAVSKHGNDDDRLRVFDVPSKKWLSEDIPMGLAYPSWDASGLSFYYTWAPSEQGLSAARRAAMSEVRHHIIGADSEKDECTRPATNQDGVFEGAEVAPNGEWLVVARFNGTSENALYVTSIVGTHPSWQLMTSGLHSRYDNYFAPDGMYIRTDEEAPNGRLFRVDLTQPARANWQEVLPARPDAILTEVAFLGQNLITGYQRDAEMVYEVRRLDGTFLMNLAPPRAGGSMASLGSSGGFKMGAVAFATYTDPYRMFLFQPPAFELELFDPRQKHAYSERYVTEKVFYTSPDGTRAPMFLVRARTTPPRSGAPTILHGYGAYGESVVPGYTKGIEAWLDRGGVYADVVLRGGGEYGAAWHEAGMRRKRSNVYTDFLAASEFLVKEKWTAPGKLVIRGGSAGGLLVTMAMIERPDLYAGVIASVPITDMIRYPLRGSGSLWLGEFGTPSDPEDFQTLFRYSPYHRVKSGVHYPPLLVLGNADDDRVDPMHARKFVAAIQSSDPAACALLRIEKDAAHEGPNTASAWTAQEADIYAFALSAVGLGGGN